jgi:hypothetical protein
MRGAVNIAPILADRLQRASFSNVPWRLPVNIVYRLLAIGYRAASGRHVNSPPPARTPDEEKAQPSLPSIFGQSGWATPSYQRFIYQGILPM